MKVFTVHEPAGLTGRGDAAARRIVFVKDGFCWPAFLIAPIWLLYHRMWLILLALLAISVALTGLEQGLEMSASLGSVIDVALLLLFGLEANNLRRWHLRRGGYRIRAVVAGRDREECERKFFADWLDKGPPPAARRTPPATPPRTAPPTSSGVIGLFPEPGEK